MKITVTILITVLLFGVNTQVFSTREAFQKKSELPEWDNPESETPRQNVFSAQVTSPSQEYQRDVLKAGGGGSGGDTPGGGTGGENLDNGQVDAETPITDGLWVLGLLAAGYCIYNRRKAKRA